MASEASNADKGADKHSLEQFNIVCEVGKGGYGQVYMGTRQGKHYAIKSIQKKKLQKEKKQYQVFIEKQLLKQMSHQGIIKLYFTFQDANKIYFALQYCHGGEFLEFIKLNIKTLNQQTRRFYVAQIIHIFEYLHSNRIAHRDLKPQNIMISKYGHLKLIDFGTAQITQCKLLKKEFIDNIASLKEKKQQEDPQEEENELDADSMGPKRRRSTFVGTCHYISPELLEKNMCEEPSDLWALGCIIYQLYYYQTPFKDSHQYAVFEKIKKAIYQFPKNQAIDEDAIDLIKNLLKRKPYERLGSGGSENLGYANLKAHPYFKGIDIDHIYEKQPPIFKSISLSSEGYAQKMDKFLANGKPEGSPNGIIEGVVLKLILPKSDLFYCVVSEELVLVSYQFGKKQKQNAEISGQGQPASLIDESKFKLKLKDEAAKWVEVINTKAKG